MNTESLHFNTLQDMAVYCRDTPAQHGAGETSTHLASHFNGGLSYAQCDDIVLEHGGYWEDGWDIRTVNGPEIVVHKQGLLLTAGAEDCRAHGGEPLAPGVLSMLCSPKEFLSLSPGFYMALSDRELADADHRGLVRFYCNIVPEAATDLMRGATQALNGARLPEVQLEQ